MIEPMEDVPHPFCEVCRRLCENCTCPEWEPWFAWHPVICDGWPVWLKTIERTFVDSLVPGGVWEYRTPPEVTK